MFSVVPIHDVRSDHAGSDLQQDLRDLCFGEAGLGAESDDEEGVVANRNPCCEGDGLASEREQDLGG